MKKPAFLLAALAASLGLLPACSRDMTSEVRASSPSAAEFNRQVSQSTKTDEEIAADSIKEAKRRRRTFTEEEPR